MGKFNGFRTRRLPETDHGRNDAGIRADSDRSRDDTAQGNHRLLPEAVLPSACLYSIEEPGLPTAARASGVAVGVGLLPQDIYRMKGQLASRRRS